MSGWPVRRLVGLYPRAWRDRYGAEVASLAEELISEGKTTPLRAGLDLAGGAVIERGRALTRSPAAGLGGAAVITAAAGIGLAVRARDGGAPGRPYFDTAPAGALLLAAAMTLLPLAVTLWRIQLEETALLTGLGERYRAYASDRKRLVPLIW